MKLPAKYTAAKKALAACVRVDEVKQFHDQAISMRVYAFQAKDRELISHAAEMVKRAKRRLGELMEAARAAGKLARGAIGKPGPGRGKRGVKNPPRLLSDPETLDEQGIGKDLAKQARAAAAMPEKKFEADVAKAVAVAVASVEGAGEVIKAARAEKHKERQAKRAQRERTVAAKIVALPTKKYGVIYADPEWQFGFWSEAGKDISSADNEYDTSELDVIKKRDVPSISADDCILFLWATVPMMPQALEVMAAWGFQYKSNFVWVKNKAGTGFWNRNKHEILLLGTKGKMPAPAQGDQWPSAIEADVRAHSQKPDKFAELIEVYFPTIPKIELNLRGTPRPGWDGWGNEAKEAAE